jgi:hypothetical protein
VVAHRGKEQLVFKPLLHHRAGAFEDLLTPQEMRDQRGRQRAWPPARPRCSRRFMASACIRWGRSPCSHWLVKTGDGPNDAFASFSTPWRFAEDAVHEIDGAGIMTLGR